MKAQAHPRQALRLATLRKYDILDTPRESDFDDIVELASHICGTPIAVVNLIDEHRQWFKAEVGLGTRETPLETSICSHVVLEQDFVEINDTHIDARTSDNELCTPSNGLRFYAGALLKAENGMPIGTLCVLDNEPRTLTGFQRKTLTTLARRVMRELDLRMALRDQRILRDEMDHRVKNSLQTVASLVRIERAGLSRGGEPMEAFDSIARRIEAVSALHEALHQGQTAGSVQLERFVARVTGYLRDAAPSGVTISSQCVELEVRAEIANAMGIIINEFAANSVKHAFSGKPGGEISFTVDSRADGQLRLVCTDNGLVAEDSKAAPETGQRPSGLGTRLIRAAASQIGGVLDWRATPQGYRLELALPAEVVSA